VLHTRHEPALHLDDAHMLPPRVCVRAAQGREVASGFVAFALVLPESPSLVMAVDAVHITRNEEIALAVVCETELQSRGISQVLGGLALV